MTANSNFNLVNLDQDGLKASFIQYLKAQPQFKDYDFTGSNMSVLLDTMSMNTYLNAFLLNMTAAEAWLDTAQLRDSVVSKSKELNYTPASFSSAKATVNVTVQAANGVTSVLIPKGYTFTARVGSNSFSFSTDQSHLITSTNNVFTAKNLDIYEGSYLDESFVVNYNAKSRYVISNETVDISSISVAVIEDSGANIISHTKAESLFGLGSNSAVFFLQGAQNNLYEVTFGDGVVGRKPKDGSTILVEYRVSNGELPNGAFLFTPNGVISGQSNVAVETVLAASGGSIAEDIESIRFNAPRHFGTQERMITPDDYEILMSRQFPEIKSISAYGGEDANPPQYGKIIIALDLKDIDGIPDSKKQSYSAYIKSRNGGIKPILTVADQTYIKIISDVKFDSTSSSLTISDVESIVSNTILTFSNTNLEAFKSDFYSSNLDTAINQSDPAIKSNETNFQLIKKLTPSPGVLQNISVSFFNALQPYGPEFRASYPVGIVRCLTSNQFIFKGQTVTLQDDGQGNINIVKQSGDTFNVIIKAGTVDYASGNVTLSNFLLDSYFGDSLRIYAVALHKDINCLNNNVLKIAADEMEVTAAPL